MWGRITVSDPAGHQRLLLLPEATPAEQVLKKGILVVVVSALTVVIIVLFAGAGVPFFRKSAGLYNIASVRTKRSTGYAIAGTLWPLQPPAYQIQFIEPLDLTDKVLVLSAGIILTMYDC